MEMEDNIDVVSKGLDRVCHK